MRNFEVEIKDRVEFIRRVVESAGADGVVYGNSGGKDSALTGILCKMACADTVGLIMPCGTKRNYKSDKDDAETIAKQFDIAKRVIDLSAVKADFISALKGNTRFNDSVFANIAPRLRMIALYAVAANENRLVAGTGNLSERYMGYFTKWGDGAYDFNPIADLTVTEIYEFLRYLNVPDSLINKAPSAGLFDDQTDEGEMGVSYQNIDGFLLAGAVNERDRVIMEKYHRASEHKRKMPVMYGS